jgi:hypothetical protein
VALCACACTACPVGALQVRIDGFVRGLAWRELAFPYPTLIEWSKVVLDVPLHEACGGGLLARLMRMPAADVAQRVRYLRRIAPYLLFDRPRGQPDAADAFLWELEQRLLGGRGGVPARPTEPARAQLVRARRVQSSQASGAGR